MTPALVTELKRLSKEADKKSHSESIVEWLEYHEALRNAAPALLEAVETMHAALEKVAGIVKLPERNMTALENATYRRRVDHETATKALARVAGLLGEGRGK
jgi:hypothetical protein